MDLKYLLALLEREEYYVKSKKHFEDIRETTMPLKSMFELSPVGENAPSIPPRNNTLISKFNKYKKSKHWLTSCWTRSKENILMWKAYAVSGVCIKSSVHNFVAAFKDTSDYHIICANMDYRGYGLSKTFWECVFSKESYYSDERETRFYFLPKVIRREAYDYNRFAINPKVMIDEIILSPYIKSQGDIIASLKRYFAKEDFVQIRESMIKINDNM